MKKSFLLILITSVISCQSNNSPISKTEAIETVENFFEALGSGDTLLLQQTLSKDFHMFEHDEKWGMNELLGLMPLTHGRIWSLKNVKFIANKKMGHITYFNQGVIPEDRSWLESALLITENDSIKISFLHSTKLYLK